MGGGSAVWEQGSGNGGSVNRVRRTGGEELWPRSGGTGGTGAATCRQVYRELSFLVD